MKKNTNETVKHENTITFEGIVSYVKSFKTKAGKDLVKGLIKCTREKHFVNVPFTIWDANNGIPEDGDHIICYGELSTSSYVKDNVTKYNTFISVDTYEAR